MASEDELKRAVSEARLALKHVSDTVHRGLKERARAVEAVAAHAAAQSAARDAQAAQRAAGAVPVETNGTSAHAPSGVPVEVVLDIRKSVKEVKVKVAIALKMHDAVRASLEAVTNVSDEELAALDAKREQLRKEVRQQNETVKVLMDALRQLQRDVFFTDLPDS